MISRISFVSILVSVGLVLIFVFAAWADEADIPNRLSSNTSAIAEKCWMKVIFRKDLAGHQVQQGRKIQRGYKSQQQ